MWSWVGTFLGAVSTLIAQWREESSDAELIARVKEGGEQSKQAFQVLVERHQKWLVALLKHLISDLQEAEDLAQNVFVKAFFALPKFRDESKFRTWLRVIATREAFNHYRKRGSSEIPTNFDEQPAIIEDDQPTAQERLHERDALNLALKKVPYPYREILVLRYIEELSLEEIGEALELGASATKMRLKRAREFFQEAYHQEDAHD